MYDKLVDEFEKKEVEIKTTIEMNEGRTIKFKKDDNEYFILSPSPKNNGYQLTNFIDNVPMYDINSKSPIDNDIIDVLALNDCEIKTIL